MRFNTIADHLAVAGFRIEDENRAHPLIGDVHHPLRIDRDSVRSDHLKRKILGIDLLRFGLSAREPVHPARFRLAVCRGRVIDLCPGKVVDPAYPPDIRRARPHQLRRVETKLPRPHLGCWRGIGLLFLACAGGHRKAEAHCKKQQHSETVAIADRIEEEAKHLNLHVCTKRSIIYYWA